MEMRAQANLNILGVSRYEFDGIRGAKVFAQKDADETNLNVIGVEVVEFGCEFTIFENFRGHNFPAEFKCEVEFGRGSKGKSAARIVAAVPAKPAPAADKTKAAA